MSRLYTGPGVLRGVPAPAKVNLFLHVLGRRDDGYHQLQTVFRFVDLCDELDFECRTDGQVRRVTPLEGVESDVCLTVRAARALQQASGTSLGADIHLRKRIPQGGGLGGGSSDAATVLLALNRLWRTGLDRAALLRLALPLGADVPVFVFGQSAFAEGVGERLQPLPLPPAWYVLIQPAAEVSTAAVFGHPDLTRDTKAVKITDFPAGNILHMPAAPDSGGQVWRFGRNDLEPVVRKHYPQVEASWQVATRALQRHPEIPATLRMSGSGACLFIECASAQQAASIQAEIAATIRSSGVAASAIRSVACFAGLSSHPLQQWAA